MSSITTSSKRRDFERLGDYRPGGYHPIHLGDVISHKQDLITRQYRVLYKLDHDDISTEWLGQRLDNDLYVVLNIGIARLRRGREDDLAVTLGALPSAPAQGSEHILRYLDHFELSGPNGIHTVFVSNLRWPIDHPGVRLQWDTRVLAYQCCLALQYLHAHGFIHAGISERSFSLGMREYKPEQFEHLRLRMGLPHCRPALPDDPESDLHRIPKYLCASSALMNARRSFFADVHTSQVRILLDRFVNTSRPQETVRNPISHMRYSSPEMIIFQRSCTAKDDVWALGMTKLLLMITGDLFISPELALHDQLKLITTKLGPLPPQYWNACHPKPYELRDREQLEHSALSTWQAVRECYLSTRLRIAPTGQALERDARELENLLRSMLNYHSDQRPSMADISRHPFFSGLSSAL
ncbi:kinase-like protein [Sistotremastrum suecicum HHB10207 ss-3]|uniref:non-specific serine/threonine protein kinase n=1 Tax=Sistotremastrum suecicum HHB10207 ss-3 TaxID=1314776 RepID=A0A165XKB3_9AGAM|nr:kinase-like protein [Sistotremastrum suecicum HHB10207 ss-3]